MLSHVSTVQLRWSLQLTGVPGWQPKTGEQYSVPLQNWLSLHSTSCPTCTHAFVISLQKSFVQLKASAHVTGEPGLQPRTGSQTSTPSQNELFWQTLALGTCAHWSDIALQKSSVQ